MKHVAIFVLLVSLGNVHSLDISLRIVNGTKADKCEFPFIVSLRNYRRYICGGSIVQKQWILTAAHCVFSRSPRTMTIQYGVNAISFSGPTIVRVNQKIMHPGFHQSAAVSTLNDIALLKLTKPIEYSNCVKPIHLPQQGYEVSNRTAVMLSGWGYQETNGFIQNELLKVGLITFSYEECKRLYKDRIHISNLCAGGPKGGKGQCTGDSGGPLVLGNVQLGIVSWSVKPCAVYPGVYTKVSYYVDWINRQISNH